MTMKYVAISTMRNEEKLLNKCLDSLFNQSIIPTSIVVVDDSSTDSTLEMLSKYPVTTITHEPDIRTVSSLRQSVALIAGVKVLTQLQPDWEFLFKFDADVILHDPNYIENLLKEMIKNPQVGVCSGNIVGLNVWTGRAVDGAKIYRRKCWDDIGGIDPVIHADTHAIIKSYWKGWKVRCFHQHEYTEVRSHFFENLYEWYMSGWARYFHGLPLWHTFGVGLIYAKRSKIIGSIVMFFGHIVALLLGHKRPSPPEYYDFTPIFAIWEIKIRILRRSLL